MDSPFIATSENESEDPPGLAILQPGETLMPIRIRKTPSIPTTIQFTEMPVPTRYPAPDTSSKRNAFRSIEHTRQNNPLIDDEDDPLGNARLEKIAARLRQPSNFSPLWQNKQANQPVDKMVDISSIVGLLFLGVGVGFLIYCLLTKTVHGGSAISSVEQGILPKQP